MGMIVIIMSVRKITDGITYQKKKTHKNMIQTKNIGRDITQGFKTLVGGELSAYNEMMNEARALATKRMCAEAEDLGADAIVNIRYSSSAVMQGAAEVIAYGTAVRYLE